MNENVATVLEAVADVVGDRTALVQGDCSRTWFELDDRASRLAAALAERGVRVGSRVAVDLYNCIEYVEVVYATLKLRATPINVNYRYRESELAYLLDDCDAGVVVFHGSLAERVVAAGRRLKHPVVLVEVPAGSPLIPEAEDYEALIANHEPAGRIERDGSDIMILYTGGTTGNPKGVIWEHRDLLGPPVAVNGWISLGLPVPSSAHGAAATAEALAEAGCLPVALPAAPLMHATALFKSLATLLLGGTVIFSEARSLDADEVCRLIEEHRVLDLSIVGDSFARPILQALAHAKDEGRPYDISSLRRIGSAGVIWSPDVKAGLARYGEITFIDILASTEGGPYALAITLPGENPLETRFHLTAVGRLLDENGDDVVPGSGQVGVLAASGSMPKGYLNDAERTAKRWREIAGVRHVISGDMAMLEQDGSVVLLGRSSEIVNTGGEKVFVEEVEQAILSYEGVQDVVVVGVPDERFGHRIAAVVSLRVGTEASERDIIDHVGRGLADHKRPRQVVFVEEVMRSPTGKANRAWAKQAATVQPTPRLDREP